MNLKGWRNRNFENINNSDHMADVHRLRRLWNAWATKTGTSLDDAIRLVGLSRYKLHRSLEGSRRISDDEYLVFSSLLGVEVSEISPFVDRKIRLRNKLSRLRYESDVVSLINHQDLVALESDDIQRIKGLIFWHVERGGFTHVFLRHVTTFNRVFDFSSDEIAYLTRHMAYREKDYIESKQSKSRFESGLCRQGARDVACRIDRRFLIGLDEFADIEHLD